MWQGFPFTTNLCLELKMSQAVRAIIFNSRRIKSSPLPLGEGLGERGNSPPPAPPDRRGANPIGLFALAKVLSPPVAISARRTVCGSVRTPATVMGTERLQINSKADYFHHDISQILVNGVVWGAWRPTRPPEDNI